MKVNIKIILKKTAFLLLLIFFLLSYLTLNFSQTTNAQSPNNIANQGVTIGGTAAIQDFFTNNYTFNKTNDTTTLSNYYQYFYDTGNCRYSNYVSNDDADEKSWISPATDPQLDLEGSNANIQYTPGTPFNFVFNLSSVFCYSYVNNSVQYPNSGTVTSGPLFNISYMAYKIDSAIVVNNGPGTITVPPNNVTLLNFHPGNSSSIIPYSIWYSHSETMTYESSSKNVSTVTIQVGITPYLQYTSGQYECIPDGHSFSSLATLENSCTIYPQFKLYFIPPNRSSSLSASCSSHQGPVYADLSYYFPALNPILDFNISYSINITKYYFSNSNLSPYIKNYTSPIKNNNTFPSGPSGVYDWQSSNPPPGNYYYRASLIYTYSYKLFTYTENSNGTWSQKIQTITTTKTIKLPQSMTVTCDYKPYFQIQSGDIVAGSNVCSTLSSPTNATISSYSADTTSAGSEYAAIATGTISNFVTGQGLYGSNNPLTFSNLNNFGTNSSNYGGNFGTSPCLTNYFNPPSSSSGPNTYTINATSPFSIPTTTIYPGQHYTYYVNGNVIINNNITFAGAVTNPAQIPSFNLIVNGNIYIAPNVSQLDGLYEALGTGGSGSIYTCNTSLTFSNCSTRLTINGSMMAQNTVHLDRTASGLIIPPYPGQSGIPTENFNLSPWLWFDQINNNSSGTPPYNENNNQLQYASLTSLPPIY